MSESLFSRRRNTPWIHRWSRHIIGAIASLGALNTGYLTLTKFLNAPTACPTGGCEQVLSSPYATVFGLPLSLFGFLAYVAMAVLALGPLAVKAGESKESRQRRSQLENWTWLLLFAGATAMLVFSGYLMNIMVAKFVAPYGLNGICYFCIASALFALSLFVVTLIGRSWDDIGQLLFTGLIVAVVTLVATLGIYAPIDAANANGGAGKNAAAELGPPILNSSGPSEIALAQYLKQQNAKMYGAYWCPHCHEQKELFGKQAVQQMPYVECSPNGPYSDQAQVCKDAKIESYPTWEVGGKQLEPGRKTLEELANASGYQGPRDFKNRL